MIRKNDLFLIYTDGVIEVFSKNKKQFGLERLTDIFRLNADKSPNEIINKIIFATKEFSSSDFYKDDFTMILLKRVS